MFAGGIETRGAAINEGPGLVDVSTIVDEAAPVIGGVTDIRRSFGSDGFPGASVDVERGLYGPDVPGYAPEVGVGGSARFESGFSIPGVPGPDTFADGSDSGGFAMPLPGSVEGSLESIHSSLGYNDDERFAAGVRSGSGFDLQQAQLDSRLYRGDGGFAARAEMMEGGAMLPGRGGIVYEERRTLPLYVGGEVRGRYVKSGKTDSQGCSHVPTTLRPSAMYRYIHCSTSMLATIPRKYFPTDSFVFPIICIFILNCTPEALCVLAYNVSMLKNPHLSCIKGIVVIGFCTIFHNQGNPYQYIV